MAKYYDKPININTNWNGDRSTGFLKVKGNRVQEFIKNTFLSLTKSINDFNNAIFGKTTWQTLIDGLVITLEDGTECRLVENETSSGKTLCIQDNDRTICLGDVDCPPRYDINVKSLILGDYFFHSENTQKYGTIVSITLNGVNVTTNKDLPLEYDYHSDETKLHLLLSFGQGSVVDMINKRVEEAPKDGKSYLRNNGKWVENTGVNTVIIYVEDPTHTQKWKVTRIEGAMPKYSSPTYKQELARTIVRANVNGISGECMSSPLATSYTGSYHFGGTFAGYGKNRIYEIIIYGSNVGADVEIHPVGSLE